MLIVEFKNGGRYNYYDMPAVMFERMKSAPSKGGFLAQSIKNAIGTPEFRKTLHFSLRLISKETPKVGDWQSIK